MTTHTTPPPHADQTDQTAEPARRASRFDERGIALQTVIILVVLLAIAGGIATVLLTRGQQASNQLAGQAVSVGANTYQNQAFCRNAGLHWEGSSNEALKCQYPTVTECENAGGVDPGAPQAGKDCKTAAGFVLGKIKA